MSRLSRVDTALVRSIERELDVFHAEQSTALDTVLPAIREAIGLPSIVAYDVRAGEAGFELGGARQDCMPFDDAVVTAGLARYVSNSRARVGYFNPLCPERAQRNRVFTMPVSQIVSEPIAPARLGLASHDRAEVERNLEIMRQLFTSFKLVQDYQIRTLLCDGDTLLCFLGGYQPEPYSYRQRAVFKALVGPLCRRLVREERFRSAPTLQAALAAALEHIAGAALLVTASGRVEHANSAGRRLCNGLRLPAELCDELRAPRRFDVMRLSGRGWPELCLMVEKPAQPELAGRVARAACRFGLTPREAEILELLASGESNRAISGRLSCSERTVEVHVTHILEKADADSRAVLIARVWSGD